MTTEPGHRTRDVPALPIPDIAAALASFWQRPPTLSTHDGKCDLCQLPVRAGHGLAAHGRKDGTTPSALLHYPCAGQIRAEQQRTARELE